MKAPKVEAYKPPRAAGPSKEQIAEDRRLQNENIRLQGESLALEKANQQRIVGETTRMEQESLAAKQTEAVAEAARQRELMQQTADDQATKDETDRIAEQRRRRGAGLQSFVTTSQRGFTQPRGYLSELLGV